MYFSDGEGYWKSEYHQLAVIPMHLVPAYPPLRQAIPTSENRGRWVCDQHGQTNHVLDYDGEVLCIACNEVLCARIRARSN